jgi:hypothetical protein
MSGRTDTDVDVLILGSGPVAFALSWLFSRADYTVLCLTQPASTAGLLPPAASLAPGVASFLLQSVIAGESSGDREMVFPAAGLSAAGMAMPGLD